MALGAMGMPMGQAGVSFGEVFSAAHGWAFCWSPKGSWQELCFFNTFGYLYLPLSNLLSTPSPPTCQPILEREMGERWVSSATPRTAKKLSAHSLFFPFLHRRDPWCPIVLVMFLLPTPVGPDIFFSFYTVECWKVFSVKPGFPQRISCSWMSA